MKMKYCRLIYLILFVSFFGCNDIKKNSKESNKTIISNNEQLIFFKDGKSAYLNVLLEQFINEFGASDIEITPETAREINICFFSNISKKVTYNEYINIISRAIEVSDNKDIRMYYLYSNEKIKNSLDNCLDYSVIIRELTTTKKLELSSDLVKLLSIEQGKILKSELAEEEYKNLIENVDFEDFVFCYTKKLFESYSINEMLNKTQVFEDSLALLMLKCFNNNKISQIEKKQKNKTDKFVLDELIEIIKSNDLQLFDKIYPSELNKQDKFIEIGNKTIKVKNRRTSGVSLFGGIAKSLGFYFIDKEIIMFESAPADLTFSKTKFNEVIQKSPIYSPIIEQGNMTIHNEYFLYKNIIVNTWRPIKDYEFKSNGVYDDFIYTSDDIYFLTITKKNIFEEMIEPMLKN